MLSKSKLKDSRYSIIIHFNHFIRRYRTSTRIILSAFVYNQPGILNKWWDSDKVSKEC